MSESIAPPIVTLSKLTPYQARYSHVFEELSLVLEETKEFAEFDDVRTAFSKVKNPLEFIMADGAYEVRYDLPRDYIEFTPKTPEEFED